MEKKMRGKKFVYYFIRFSLWLLCQISKETFLFVILCYKFMCQTPQIMCVFDFFSFEVFLVENNSILWIEGPLSKALWCEEGEVFGEVRKASESYGSPL